MTRALVAVHSELDVTDLPGGSTDGLDDFRLVRALGRLDEVAVRVAVGLTEDPAAICVGPPDEDQWLRRCHEFGAGTLLRVWDESWGTREPSPAGIAALIAAVARRDACELVVTGVAGSTWGSAYVGPAVAELLGAAQVDNVVSATLLDGSTVEAVQALARGYRRRLRVGLPAVLTVGDSAEVSGTPPTLPRMIHAQSAPVSLIRPADLDVSVTASAPELRLLSPRPRAKRSGAAGGAAALSAIMGGGKRPAKDRSAAGAADPATQIIDFLTSRGLTPWHPAADPHSPTSKG